MKFVVYSIHGPCEEHLEAVEGTMKQLGLAACRRKRQPSRCMSLLIVYVAILLLWCPPLCAQNAPKRGESLAVSSKIVAGCQSFTIVGPKEFVTTVNNWDGEMRPWLGSGFSIDWGDGSCEPPQNADLGPGWKRDMILTHLYSKPGKYIIRTKIWHPGPNDLPVFDWLGVATIEVTNGVFEQKGKSVHR